MLMRCVLPELRTPIDLQRFSGRWFELARTRGIPFEPDDITDVQANYSWSGGVFGITNSARRPDGRPMQWSTRVVRIANQWNTRFELENNGIYRILMLDTDNYEWAVVAGNESNSMVWVLARETLLTAERWRAIFDELRDFFDVDLTRIQYTRHDTSPRAETVPPPAEAPPVPVVCVREGHYQVVVTSHEKSS